MYHNQNHLYTQRKGDGKIVFIDDVPLGKIFGCVCTKCKKPLIAKNAGKINIHHFAQWI